MAEHIHRLHDLLAAWRQAVAGTGHPQPPPYDGPDIALTGFTEKTAEAAPGVAFVARVRTGSDGHPYIPEAIARGASLILAQRPPAATGVADPAPAVYWQVPDTAETLAWLAAAWEGFPSRQLVMIGITGTDGKTTTANLLFGILRAAGLPAGLLSTIKAVIGDEEESLALHVTTPEAPVVQRYLRRMVDAGLTHCILESTSHALAQHRVGAVDFDLAVVTNITHEHLDYHGSFEAYFTAKRRLFDYLLIEPVRVETSNNDKRQMRRTAVLNRDDNSYAPLSAFLAGRAIDVRSYGLESGNQATATSITYGPQVTHFNLHLTGETVTQPIRSALAGEFNIHNMLAAAAAAAGLGVAPEAIRAGLESVAELSGRMERVDVGQPFLVIVDFAHTPNALERAIGAARRMTAPGGRVIAVFGSAGKRDVEKRRLMAGISARRADLIVLTAEDPRTESLDGILTTMAAAAAAEGGVEGETFWRVPDRGRAIYFALSLAQPGDVVLVCGKGHEQSMCFGATEFPWDDRDATRAALEAWLSGLPMVDLGLPTFQTT